VMTSVSVVVVVFLRLCVDYNSFRLHLSTTRFDVCLSVMTVSLTVFKSKLKSHLFHLAYND